MALRTMARWHDYRGGCMSRLTEKVGNTYGAYQQISNAKKPFLINNVTNKLGQLEDLEQKLSVDLITAFSFIGKIVYRIETWTKTVIIPYTIKSLEIDKDYKLVFRASWHEQFSFSAFNEVWSLTKAEAEKYLEGKK